jgi:hypothetical protein
MPFNNDSPDDRGSRKRFVDCDSAGPIVKQRFQPGWVITLGQEATTQRLSCSNAAASISKPWWYRWIRPSILSASSSVGRVIVVSDPAIQELKLPGWTSRQKKSPRIWDDEIKLKAFETIMPERSKRYILAVWPYTPRTNTKQLEFPSSRLRPFLRAERWSGCAGRRFYTRLSSNGSWLVFALTSIVEATKCRLWSVEEESWRCVWWQCQVL